MAGVPCLLELLPDARLEFDQPRAHPVGRVDVLPRQAGKVMLCSAGGPCRRLGRLGLASGFERFAWLAAIRVSPRARVVRSSCRHAVDRAPDGRRRPALAPMGGDAGSGSAGRLGVGTRGRRRDGGHPGGAIPSTMPSSSAMRCLSSATSARSAGWPPRRCRRLLASTHTSCLRPRHHAACRGAGHQRGVDDRLALVHRRDRARARGSVAKHHLATIGGGATLSSPASCSLRSLHRRSTMHEALGERTVAVPTERLRDQLSPSTPHGVRKAHPRLAQL